MVFFKDQKSYIVLMERIMAIFKLSSEALPLEEILERFANPEGLISAMKRWHVVMRSFQPLGEN